MFRGRGWNYGKKSYSNKFQRYGRNLMASTSKSKCVRKQGSIVAEISYINDINTLSGSCGISKEKLIKRISDLEIKIYNGGTYIAYSDAVRLMNSLNINYKLDGICTVEYDLENSIKSKQVELVKTTITILGHINHGKTTLISSLVNDAVISEDYSITQNISIYEKDGFVLIDTPGHQVFSPTRKNIIEVTDCFIVVVSLSQGIELETTRVLCDLVSWGLISKTIIVFTKQDIAKYDYKDLIKQIIKITHYVDIEYIVYTSGEKDVLFATITLIVEKEDSTHKYDSVNYHGLVVKYEIIDGVMYHLVKLIKGHLQRNMTMFSIGNNESTYGKAEICRILDLGRGVIYKQAKSMGYYYVATSKPLGQRATFVVLGDKLLESKYDKLLVAKQILSPKQMGDGCSSNKVKFVFVVGDSITQEVVSQVIIDNKLEDNSKIVLYSNQFSPHNYQNVEKIVFYNYPCRDDVLNVSYIDNIYQLLAFIKSQSTDISDNPNVIAAAYVVKVFNIKGCHVAGCVIKHGAFSMYDQVNITVEKNECGVYSMKNAVKTKIVSLKSKNTFVKKTKVCKEYGIALKGVWDLEVGMYIFKV